MRRYYAHSKGNEAVGAGPLVKSESLVDHKRNQIYGSIIHRIFMERKNGALWKLEKSFKIINQTTKFALEQSAITAFTDER